MHALLTHRGVLPGSAKRRGWETEAALRAAEDKYARAVEEQMREREESERKMRDAEERVKEAEQKMGRLQREVEVLKRQRGASVGLEEVRLRERLDEVEAALREAQLNTTTAETKLEQHDSLPVKPCVSHTDTPDAARQPLNLRLPWLTCVVFWVDRAGAGLGHGALAFHASVSQRLAHPPPTLPAFNASEQPPAVELPLADPNPRKPRNSAHPADGQAA
eukprot:344332-Rhodomonas_salina.3